MMKKTIVSFLGMLSLLLTFNSCRDRDIPLKNPFEISAGKDSKDEKSKDEKSKDDPDNKDDPGNKDDPKNDEKNKNDDDNKPDESTKDRPFITTWWVGENNKISIPLSGQYFDKYDYTVRWVNLDKPYFKGEVHVKYGDTNRQKGVITLPEWGEYRLEISGNFPAVFFYASGYAENLRRIEQWGSIKWETMKGAFSGCRNLQITAKDAPDLSRVRDMSYMLEDAWNFNQPVNHWDVSKVTNMNGLFAGATRFNQPLDKWDVSNVKNFRDMFKFAKFFNQPLNSWNLNARGYGIQYMFNDAESFNKMNVNSWRNFLTDREMNSLFW